jgi:Rieske Fe-S protein
MLAVGLSVPLFSSLVAMLRRVQTGQQPTTFTISPDVAVGLSVVEGVLVYRGNDGTIRAYSARCTHLGCRIDRIVGDEAVCPCHGSRYRADGTASAGPATRSLTPLNLEHDPATGGWVARVS